MSAHEKSCDKSLQTLTFLSTLCSHKNRCYGPPIYVYDFCWSKEGRGGGQRLETRRRADAFVVSFYPSRRSLVRVMDHLQKSVRSIRMCTPISLLLCIQQRQRGQGPDDGLRRRESCASHALLRHVHYGFCAVDLWSRKLSSTAAEGYKKSRFLDSRRICDGRSHNGASACSVLENQPPSKLLEGRGSLLSKIGKLSSRATPHTTGKTNVRKV